MIITQLLSITGSENRNIVLLGDLNIHVDNPEDPNAGQILAILEAFGLEQHITFPTHQLGHTLDLIATESKFKLTCPPIPGPYLSDHRSVIIETNNRKLTETPQYREYRKLTEAAIMEFQQSFNNQPILDVTNLEDAVNQQNVQMLRSLDKVAPMKKRRSVKKNTKIMVQQGSSQPKENSKKQTAKMAEVQRTTSVDSLQKKKKLLQSNDEIPQETQHIHKI